MFTALHETSCLQNFLFLKIFNVVFRKCLMLKSRIYIPLVFLFQMDTEKKIFNIAGKRSRVLWRREWVSPSMTLLTLQQCEREKCFLERVSKPLNNCPLVDMRNIHILLESRATFYKLHIFIYNLDRFSNTGIKWAQCNGT